MINSYEYSFIVPVYNAEKYIKRCIESILKQGDSCEIILVDDGSPDNSGRICDQYAEKYNNIKVFHNKNSGPAYARNFGLEKSTGKFIIFLDSDDYVSENLIRDIETNHIDKNSDLIFYTITKKFTDGRLEPMSEGLVREKIYNKSTEEILNALSECSKFPASTGGKIIKRDFLINNNIKFREKLYGEDIDWTFQLIYNMNSADVYNAGNYFYCISVNTRRSFGNVKSLSGQLEIIEYWLKKAKINPNHKYFLSFLAYQYAICLPFYGAISKSDKALYKERLKKLKYLLSSGKTKKIKMVKLAVNLLGIDNAALLLYKYVSKRDESDG